MEAIKTSKSLLAIILSCAAIIGILVQLGGDKALRAEQIKEIPSIRKGLGEANLKIHNHEIRIENVEKRLDKKLDVISNSLREINRKLGD